MRHVFYAEHDIRKSQQDLLTAMERRTGRSRESIRGTIIGDANGRKLFGQPYFKKNWAICVADPVRGKRKRLVRRRYMTSDDVEAGSTNFDTPAKKTARERGLNHLPPGDEWHKIITLAAEEGLCVKHILSLCPNAVIYNIEQDPKVLERWVAHSRGLDIYTKNICGRVRDFIHTDFFRMFEFRMFNADLIGYASRELGKDLTLLNELANVQTIVLTLAGIKKIRNHGWWVDWAKSTFRSEDPTQEWLETIMTNYDLVDSWFYTRDPSNRSRQMRMFVLERI